jgi:uncharacterized protein (TIGR03435 family)
MNMPTKILVMVSAVAFATVPLLSQNSPSPATPTFEVVSIKPTAPTNFGLRGGGPRGDRFSVSGLALKELVQMAYGRANSNGAPFGQIPVIGGPSWLDSDRFDVQAKADCGGGVISREQLQLMVRSMLEDRFQLKAHIETRELPVYDLVVGKDGPKLKVSADQTTPPIAAGGGPQVCGPAPTLPGPLPPPPGPGQRGPDLSSMPRGAMVMMMNPSGLTMQATAVPVGNMVNLLQNFVGRPVIDKTALKGLFDIKLTFSPEGLTFPGGRGGGPGGPGPGAPVVGGQPAGPLAPTDATEPVPSLFTAIQDLGLKLESSKGPVEVVVIESAQKPTEN